MSEKCRDTIFSLDIHFLVLLILTQLRHIDYQNLEKCFLSYTSKNRKWATIFLNQNNENTFKNVNRLT